MLTLKEKVEAMVEFLLYGTDEPLPERKDIVQLVKVVDTRFHKKISKMEEREEYYDFIDYLYEEGRLPIKEVLNKRESGNKVKTILVGVRPGYKQEHRASL